MGARNSVMIGAAGEDFVLYQLHIRDVLAAQAPPNAYAADIVVFSPRMSVGSMVQVKTRTGGRNGGWHMSQKHENLTHPRLFYAFVDFEPDTPATYVLPSAVVAEAVTESHRAWLAAPGVRGRPHRDSSGAPRLRKASVPDVHAGSAGLRAARGSHAKLSAIYVSGWDGRFRK